MKPAAKPSPPPTRSTTSSSATGACTSSPLDPADGAPAVAVRRVHLAERRHDRLHVRAAWRRPCSIIVEERLRIELRATLLFAASTSGPGMPEALLEILLVADEDVDVLDDPADDLDRLRLAAPDVPELLAEVEVEARDGAGRLRRLHAPRRSARRSSPRAPRRCRRCGTSGRRARRSRPSRSRPGLSCAAASLARL